MCFNVTCVLVTLKLHVYYIQPAARLAWEKRSENKCILNKDFNHQKYSNQDKLQLKESKFPPRNRSKSVHSNR